MGGIGYAGLEILWRGYTHWTMALTGGVVFVGLERLRRQMEGVRLPVRCAVGAAWVTAAEFLVGVSVNLGLHMNVWDYSAEWGNILGQICPKYTAIWFALCGPAMAIAGSSAKLLANAGHTEYNANGNMPEMRFLRHADSAGHRKQSREIWRVLRGRYEVRRLDSDRRPVDRGTVCLPAARGAWPVRGQTGAD
ncbi:MAG: hypothetical protein ACI3XZ_02975 [Butyricicoccus sp.]